MSCQDSVICGNIHNPQNLEFPSIQNNSIPVDFEAQLKEIDKALERKVSKEYLSAQKFLDSFSFTVKRSRFRVKWG